MFKYNQRINDEYTIVQYGWIFFLYYMQYLIEIEDYESCQKIKSLLIKSNEKFNLGLILETDNIKLDELLFNAFKKHNLTGEIAYNNIGYYIDNIHQYLTEDIYEVF